MAWYYANQGQQAGPVDDAAFENLVRQGVVRDDSLVWKEGMAEWKPYSAVRPAPMAAAPTVVMQIPPGGFFADRPVEPAPAPHRLPQPRPHSRKHDSARNAAARRWSANSPWSTERRPARPVPRWSIRLRRSGRWLRSLCNRWVNNSSRNSLGRPRWLRLEPWAQWE
jgi:hypothetical protein